MTTSTLPSPLDTLDVWLSTPEHAYLNWIRLQDLRPSTQRVYVAMFTRFSEWLTDHQLRLDQCSADTIRSFLAAANPNLPPVRQCAQTSRQRQQYVRLLDRVFVHLGNLGLTGSNPGRQASVERVGAGADRPARFLTVTERETVIALAENRLADLHQSGASTNSWVELRDLALFGTALGGGLKPSQLSTLTLNCISLKAGAIVLSDVAYPHRAKLLPFAQKALAAWLHVHEALCAETLATNEHDRGTIEQWRASQLVFVADRSGNGFGRFADSHQMHVSSIFRRIQNFLVAGGISGNRMGPQTLRNTYAAQMIIDGATDMDLLMLLGVATEITVKRIRASWANFQVTSS